jgi:predicted enzyme related to lactoylglutathione lyase
VSGCQVWRRPGPGRPTPMVSSPTIRLRSVVFDCPDPPALASFYADLIDGRPDLRDPEWCEVQVDDLRIKLAFQLARPYSPPEWPYGAAQQLHLDLTVQDLAEAGSRALALGARLLGDPVEEPGSVFIVYADPAGHPFCLCEDR